ncbi:hypothetical protein Trydic_g7224 [Trypoxylus dichotomus]
MRASAACGPPSPCHSWTYMDLSDLRPEPGDYKKGHLNKPELEKITDNHLRDAALALDCLYTRTNKPINQGSRASRPSISLLGE